MIIVTYNNYTFYLYFYLINWLASIYILYYHTYKYDARSGHEYSSLEHV